MGCSRPGGGEAGGWGVEQEAEMRHADGDVLAGTGLGRGSWDEGLGRGVGIPIRNWVGTGSGGKDHTALWRKLLTTLCCQKHAT